MEKMAVKAPQGLHVNNRRCSERSEWNRRIVTSLDSALQGLNIAATYSSTLAGLERYVYDYPPVPLRFTDGFPCDGAPFLT